MTVNSDFSIYLLLNGMYRTKKPPLSSFDPETKIDRVYEEALTTECFIIANMGKSGKESVVKEDLKKSNSKKIHRTVSEHISRALPALHE